jgi:hypothetical protein
MWAATNKPEKSVHSTVRMLPGRVSHAASHCKTTCTAEHVPHTLSSLYGFSLCLSGHSYVGHILTGHHLSYILSCPQLHISSMSPCIPLRSISAPAPLDTNRQTIMTSQSVKSQLVDVRSLTCPISHTVRNALKLQLALYKGCLSVSLALLLTHPSYPARGPRLWQPQAAREAALQVRPSQTTCPPAWVPA